MSIIKSISVGDGDMFYIQHGSDSFSLIDCCMDDFNQEQILSEIKSMSRNKGIHRFVSTHPDQDHIRGLEALDKSWPIPNFYCVKNEAKKDENTKDFEYYKALRDDESKACYVHKGCTRSWINRSTDERGAAGINFLWPDLTNDNFKGALATVKEGHGFNNISPIFTYSLDSGVKAMWLGDMEKIFLEKIKDEIDWPEIDILFAPHHGRESGTVPTDVLKKLNPTVVVIGEASSEYLNYYPGYNTITQNSAGDIVFDCESDWVHVYVGESNYKPFSSFLINEGLYDSSKGKYIGSFKTK